MGDAYTPGLTVTDSTVVRKTRRLPLAGQVLVTVGARVRATDVVARTFLPGRVHLLNLASKLGVLPDELGATLCVQPGAPIQPGTLLGEHRSFFGLFRTRAASPIEGTFESVSSVTGQAVLREPPTPVEVSAYVDGEVVEVLADEGVVVQTRAAMVQGIFGLAGETHAPLLRVVDRPDQPLLAEHIGEACAGRILIGGGRVSLAALRRAVDCNALGIVAGGVAYQDVKELLGYDVGVAVTGNERIGTTLVVTEGFGDIAMASATFELLCRHEGQTASINGATQIRAGVIRPEVVIPHDRATVEAGASGPLGLEVGAPVRCIRAPHFGRIGKVAALPIQLVELPSETRVRVVEVELDGAERVTVPRANVEVIEG
jgi:hypothetical protein